MFLAEYAHIKTRHRPTLKIVRENDLTVKNLGCVYIENKKRERNILRNNYYKQG